MDKIRYEMSKYRADAQAFVQMSLLCTALNRLLLLFRWTEIMKCCVGEQKMVSGQMGKCDTIALLSLNVMLNDKKCRKTSYSMDYV